MRKAWVALAWAPVVLAVACGGGDDGGSDTTSVAQGGSGNEAGHGATGQGGAGGDVATNTCSVELEGATGGEPDGLIPVCCSPTPAEKADIETMLGLINDERAARSLPALTYDDDLEAAMQGHCLHMALHPFFNPVAPEAAVETCEQRATHCGAVASGQNLAMAPGTPSEVFTLLQDDPIACGNLYSEDVGRIGIGHHDDLWGYLFGP